MKKKFIDSLNMIIPLALFGWTAAIFGGNQTEDLSPILPGSNLPFQIKIEQADFSLPNGIQSYVHGIYNNYWLFITGRTNGVHGFDNSENNFPPQAQNSVVYVVNPEHETVYFRSLTDISSGLSQEQIDSLSVTSAQSYQKGSTLYITGGYGVNSATGNFNTKDTLTAIDLPGLMHWVVNPSPGETAIQHIRQISDPIFKVTGGYMNQIGSNPTLLIFGQNFKGFYYDDSNGDYTLQVRRFHIYDDGKHLDFKLLPILQATDNPNYRRRDLNVVPIVQERHGKPVLSYTAYSGVFTLEEGVWTIPVDITADGKPTMENPLDPDTFKQGMNQYVCPTFGLYSKKRQAMYTVFPGGISFGFFENGVFQTDPEIPFTNQITTIRIDRNGKHAQFLMDAEYPYIFSQTSNPGNQLLFGAGADFVPRKDLPAYKNGVLKLDLLGSKPVVIGHIVGGIQSTLPNTNTISDSGASPYIFKVILIPGHGGL